MVITLPGNVLTHNNPEGKVHKAKMGPNWVLSAPDGPDVVPMNLAQCYMKGYTSFHWILQLCSTIADSWWHPKWLSKCKKTHIWWSHQMEIFPCYWPIVQGIHQSLVNSQHKGQWCGALMFSLICDWTNSWTNNGDAGDLRRHHAH